MTTRFHRASILSVALALVLPFTVAVAAAQEEPPQLHVGIEAPHVVSGMHFDPTATTATVTLDSGGDGSVDASWEVPTDFPDGGGSTLGEGTFELWGPFEGEDGATIDPGDVVTATMGDVTTQHTVIDLAVTAVVAEQAVVTGTAPEGTGVGVFAHSHEDEGGVPVRWPVADATGTWTADFAAAPDPDFGEYGQFTSFGPDDQFNILAFDEFGNATAVQRPIPEEPGPDQPWISATVWPDGRLDGEGWSGADVHVAIDRAPPDGTPDATLDLPVDTFTDDTYHDGFHFRATLPIGAVTEFSAGDVVTVTAQGGDVDGITRTLTVADLAVSSVDRASATVAGTADPGADLHLARWGDDLGHPHEDVAAPVDGSGAWTGTFSGLWGGIQGEAAISDDDGDQTRVDWGVAFVAAGIDVDGPLSDGDAAWGGYWYFDETVTVTVSRAGSVVFGPTPVAGGADWWRGFGVSFDDLDLAVGDVVTATGAQSGTTEHLTVEAVHAYWTDWVDDGSGNTVYGTTTAPAGSTVQVGVNDHDVALAATVDADGGWLVDFDDLPADREQIQVGEGIGGGVSVLDDVGNRNFTMWGDQNAPVTGPPVVYASVTEQYLEGHQWFDDASVTVAIGDCPVVEREVVDGEFQVDNPAELGCDFAAGLTLTIAGDDSGQVRELVLGNVAVTDVDVAAATVTGTADPGTEIAVSLHDEVSPAARHDTADDDGVWTVDFSTTVDPVEEGEWQFGTHPFDEETTGTAIQFDEDGDATSTDWHVLQPTVLATTLHNTVHLADWPGEPVTIEVADDASGSDPVFTTMVEFEGSRFGREADVALEFDLQAGHLLVASDGTTTRSMVVSSLTVDRFDFAASDIAGTAEPATDVLAFVGGDDTEQERTTTSDDLGDWVADFEPFGDVVEGAAMVLGDFAHTVVPFAAEHVTGLGSVATDDGPTRATITGPDDAEFAITETDVTGTTEDGWLLLGRSFAISSTISGSIEGPLQLTFLVDANVIPDGEDASTLVVLRDGDVVPDCVAPLDSADDFPCVSVRATHDDGTVELVVLTLDLSTWTVAVAHEGPTVAGLGPIAVSADVVAVGTAVDAWAPLVDLPDGAEVEATWDWGDGSTSAGALEGQLVTGSHTWAEPGVYEVAVEVTMDGTTTWWRRYEFVVVHDPTAGFVTGGGWIWSPPGAVTAAPDLAGRASFGFVAKYHKGAQEPDGTTQFEFSAAGLEFRSTSYDWLVVAGDSRALFKGQGTLDGVSGHGFMLTVTDDPDTFRIRIWEVATDEIVYDNQVDGDVDGTVLGGGSVVIHTAKPAR